MNRALAYHPDDRFPTPAQETWEHAAALAVTAAGSAYDGGFDPSERSYLATMFESALSEIEDARERAKDVR